MSTFRYKHLYHTCAGLLGKLLIRFRPLPVYHILHNSRETAPHESRPAREARCGHERARPSPLRPRGVSRAAPKVTGRDLDGANRPDQGTTEAQSGRDQLGQQQDGRKIEIKGRRLNTQQRKNGAPESQRPGPASGHLQRTNSVRLCPSAGPVMSASVRRVYRRPAAGAADVAQSRQMRRTPGGKRRRRQLRRLRGRLGHQIV